MKKWYAVASVSLIASVLFLQDSNACGVASISIIRHCYKVRRTCKLDVLRAIELDAQLAEVLDGYCSATFRDCKGRVEIGSEEWSAMIRQRDLMMQVLRCGTFDSAEQGQCVADALARD
jgi:hypothetical protein